MIRQATLNDVQYIVSLSKKKVCVLDSYQNQPMKPRLPLLKVENDGVILAMISCSYALKTMIWWVL